MIVSSLSFAQGFASYYFSALILFLALVCDQLLPSSKVRERSKHVVERRGNEAVTTANGRVQGIV